MVDCLTDMDIAQHSPSISLTRWFVGYGTFLAAGCVLLVTLMAGRHMAPGAFGSAVGEAIWKLNPQAMLDALGMAGQDIVLLFMAMYLSICTTFLPLPTAPVVSLAAMRDAGVGDGMWSMIIIVSAVAAAGSTLANLNDYHVFTWMLRNRRISRIRQTRVCQWAQRWFQRGPFAILFLFNIVQIPVDVSRMVCAVHGYPRRLFALSNFMGRFIRYSVVAFVTYKLHDMDWLAPLIFLALGLAVVLGKAIASLLQRTREPAPAVSKTSPSNK